MKKATIIKIDLRGFQSKASGEEVGDTANYLKQYYHAVAKLIRKPSWRLIKTMGDCVLIEAEKNLSFLSVVYQDLRAEFDIVMDYRICEYETFTVGIGDYACEDVAGKDIGCLFRNDDQTHRMR